MANGNGEARSSRMEAELHKRKLDLLQNERNKLQEKIVKDSDAAFKGALLSNIKALEKMNKNLDALGGAVSSGKKATAKSMTVNHAKVMARNTEMMVKHAVSQVNLLKSIDKSLINVASLLKPQFKVFERNLDALAVKVMDKTPVRTFQTMQDPKRSIFKKVLDGVFGAKAPSQTVYVQNWKEIKEGNARTRTDALGKIGQLLSTGVIGRITGLGDSFARGARFENTGRQHNRVMTEMRQGGDPAKILAREKAAASMTEVEKLYSGARGNAATFNIASVIAMGSKEGRKDLSDIFTKMIEETYNNTLAYFRTALLSDATGLYGGDGSSLKKEFDSLREIAKNNTQFSRAKIKTEKPIDFSKLTNFIPAGDFADVVKGKASTLKQKGSEFIHSTAESVKSGIDTIKEIFSKMYGPARIKLVTKSMITVLKINRNINKIRKNTDEMLKVMNLGAKGKGGSRKGLFGRLREKIKNRKSFRITEKRKGTGTLLSGAAKAVGGYAKLKTATIRGVLGGLGSLFGKGSFKMSGISSGKTKLAAQAALSPIKGAAFVGKKGISGVRGLFGKLFGGDSFKLRRSKEKKEARLASRGGFLSRFRGKGKDKLVYKIYKLLKKRLPTKREWKKLGRGGKNGLLSSILKNPATLIAGGAAIAVKKGFDAIKNADFSGKEAMKAGVRNAKQKKASIEAMHRADVKAKKKFGVSVTEFVASDKYRASKGKATIGSMPVLQELKSMGYNIDDDIPSKAISKAKANIKAKEQKAKAVVKKIESKPLEIKDVYNAPNTPVGQSVTAIPTQQRVVSYASKSSEDLRMEKMMKFLIGEFTNNLVLNMEKSDSNNKKQTTSGKGTAQGLNVFK